MELYQGVSFETLSSASTQVRNNFISQTPDATLLEILDMSEEEYESSVLTLIDSLDKYEYDLRNWSGNPLQEYRCYPFILEITDKVKSFDNLVSLYSSLDSIQERAINSLSCTDLTITIGTIEVAKKSAYLWSPVYVGGLGYYEKNFGTFTDSDTTVTVFRAKSKAGQIIGEVVLADAISSASYFSGMGIGLALGFITPGTNVAIFGMWGISTAFASGMAAIKAAGTSK